MLLSLADSATRRLSSPPRYAFDILAAFSPDGSALAFVRGSGSGIGFVEDLFVVPVTGGEPKRLTFDNCPISGVSWTPDGREIVFSSSRGGLSRLWRISASGGTPRPLAGIGVNAAHPSISPRGNQLAYIQFAFNESIWRVDSKDDNHRKEPPMHVISGKPTARLPHFSPDGKRVAFDSDRSGYSEIWACDSDGSNCAQVTSLHARATNARWSPDSRFAAFEFHPQEHSEIGVVEVAGGLPRLVPTFPGADNAGPSWSRDGQWIYFHSNHGGGAFQVWKVPVGGGSPVQVTKNTGLYGVESADGRSIYYLKTPEPGVWKMPLSGDEETRVLDQPPNWWHWELARNGIYFISFGEKGPPKATLKFFEFATRKITSIRTLEKVPGPGLTLAADGKSILYVQNEFEQSSIMLVKNFR